MGYLHIKMVSLKDPKSIQHLDNFFQATFWRASYLRFGAHDSAVYLWEQNATLGKIEDKR